MTGLAKVSVPVLGVLLVAAGITGAVWWGGKLFATSTAHEAPAASVDATPAPPATIPPIDTVAPAELETATFALG